MRNPGRKRLVDLETRIDALDWAQLEQDLWERGYTKTSQLLTREECDRLVGLYKDEARFRRS